MILPPMCSPWILAAAVVSAAGATPAGDAPAENGRVAEPIAAAPTADALLALERQANHAYVTGDGKFFERLLSDKLVMQKGGVRMSKADVIRTIVGVKCDEKERWSLTEPQMLKVDNDVYVLIYQSNRKRDCSAETTSTPVRAATVWVRHGDTWQVAFHGENAIVDPTAQPSANTTNSATNDHAVASLDKLAAPAAAVVTADPITGALMAAENSTWEAWMKHDGSGSNDLTAKNIAFVDIFGNFFANKAATIRDWTSPLCEVRSFTLTDGVGTSVSPRVGILTLTGMAVGTCGGQDISGQKIHGNSVYVKDGSAWKWAFGFNSPS